MTGRATSPGIGKDRAGDLTTITAGTATTIAIAAGGANAKSTKTTDAGTGGDTIATTGKPSPRGRELLVHPAFEGVHVLWAP